MGYIDWNDNGIEPHEVARTAALAHMAAEEFEGTDDEAERSDRDVRPRPAGDSRAYGCGVMIGGVIAFFGILYAIVHVLYTLG